MPYIPNREDFTTIESQLATFLGSKQLSSGELNYLITRICVMYLKSQQTFVTDPRFEGKSVQDFRFNPMDFTYTQLSEIVKTLDCVKNEYWDRVMRVFEDLKKLQNGDVYD